MCANTAKATKSYVLHLDAHPSASKSARTALAANLGNWALEDLFDDAELVTGELVANAAKLGYPFSLKLINDETAVIIEVTDPSAEEPRVIDHTGDSGAEEGRGMFIVQHLSRKWGVRPEENGKTVWARVGI